MLEGFFCGGIWREEFSSGGIFVWRDFAPQPKYIVDIQYKGQLNFDLTTARGGKLDTQTKLRSLNRILREELKGEHWKKFVMVEL